MAWQFAPVIVPGGRVYRFEDIAGYFEPLWTAAARAMRDGRWPIWDGGAWSGQPLAGDPQLGAFYPLNWLWCVMPVLRAYAISAALHALLGGVGMYVLARVRGASREGAALAGVALGVGGYVVLQVRHIMFVEATAWMPWLVAAGWRLLETRRAGRRAGWLAATAAATGPMLLTGGVSMIYYGAWFAAAVLLPRALARDRASQLPAAPGVAATQRGTAASPNTAMQHGLFGIAALVAAGALGVLLAAPSIIPALAHGRLSPRALGADESFAGSIAWGGLHFLPSLFLPNVLGQQVRGDYMGGGTQWEIAGYYTGMLTFALGLLAIFGGPRARRSERLSLGLVMLGCVLLAPGDHSPLHHLACRVLPLYSTMRCPPRALYVVALAMPMLAADGLDLLLARLAARPVLQRTTRSLAPLLVALDLLVTHRAENPTTTLAAAHNEAFPDVVDFLRANLRPGERYVNDVHLRHDLHNSGLLWDLPNAGGYSSLPLWRYLHLLWMANHGRVYPHDKLHDDLSAQGIWNFDSPIVDALGVRFVLAPKAWDPKCPGYAKRFDGKDGIDVWENVEVLPRAWVVYPRSGRPRDPSKALLDPRFDPRTQLFAEAPNGESIDVGSGEPEPDQPPVAIESITRGESELRLRATAKRDALLVIAQPAHPGWRATVDGKRAEVMIADYAISAIELPAGTHEITLKMTARPVDVGLMIGGAALLCIAAIALGELLRARRRRAG